MTAQAFITRLVRHAFGERYRSTFDSAYAFTERCHTVSMASCPKCDEFLESLSFEKPGEYLELARRLIGLVDQHVLQLMESTCPLRDLFNPEWPADMVEHNFQCNTCGRCFQLFADTYRGHAGWGLTGPQTKEPVLEQSGGS